MSKEFRTYRVWLLAAALILVWLLFALLSRCGRADAVTDGRDGVVVCDTMPRLCPTPADNNKWLTVPILEQVKPVSPNKPPNMDTRY